MPVYEVTLTLHSPVYGKSHEEVYAWIADHWRDWIDQEAINLDCPGDAVAVSVSKMSVFTMSGLGDCFPWNSDHAPQQSVKTILTAEREAEKGKT